MADDDWVDVPKSKGGATAVADEWEDVKPAKKQAPGFWSHVGSAAKNVASGIMQGMPTDPATAAALGVQQAKQVMTEDAMRQQEGRSLTYRIAAPTAQTLVPGLNPRAMEEAANKGDTAGVWGEAVVPAAMAISPLAAEGLGKATGAARESIGNRIRTPEGNLTPGAELTGRVIGGTIGGAPGAIMKNPYIATGGASAGAAFGPSLMERIFPESSSSVAARELFKTTKEFTEAQEAAIKLNSAIDKAKARADAMKARQESASQRLNDKLAAQKASQEAKNAPKPSPFPGATPSDAPVGTADLPAPKAQQPFPQVVKKADVAPETSVFPEPRKPLPGDKPGAMWSIGREELPGAARRGAPGAGDVLQNLNKPILYLPKEGVGYPGPRPNLMMSETEMPLKDLAGDRPEIGEASPTERRQSSPYEREIFQKMLDNPEGEQLGQSMKAAREGSEGAATEGPARRLIGSDPELYARFRKAELAGDTATMREILVAAKKKLAKVGKV